MLKARLLLILSSLFFLDTLPVKTILFRPPINIPTEFGSIEDLEKKAEIFFKSFLRQCAEDFEVLHDNFKMRTEWAKEMESFPLPPDNIPFEYKGLPEDVQECTKLSEIVRDALHQNYIEVGIQQDPESDKYAAVSDYNIIEVTPKIAEAILQRGHLTDEEIFIFYHELSHLWCFYNKKRWSTYREWTPINHILELICDKVGIIKHPQGAATFLSNNKTSPAAETHPAGMRRYQQYVDIMKQQNRVHLLDGIPNPT